MDPNQTLAEIRQLTDRLLNHDYGSYNHEEVAFDGVTLAEKFQALDEWLTKNGFTPNTWESSK